MKPSVLQYLRCPLCEFPELRLAGQAPQDEDIAEATVDCAGCHTGFAVCNGILDLNPAPTGAASSEIEGHRKIAEKWLEEIVPEELHHLVTGECGTNTYLRLPHCDHPELIEAIPNFKRLEGIAEDYFEVLDWLELRPGQVVVEAGAHMGWSARHLAARGATVIATDISPGMEYSRQLLARSAFFEHIYCDMLVFPFRPASLDLVFAVATIHHAGDLSRVFTGFQRALKPGGRAVFFAEPVAGRWDAAAKSTFGAKEKELGIQEHIYTISEYFSAARAAGLRPSVVPQTSLLRGANRNWPLMRRLGLATLRSGLGYTALFTRFIYPLMLQFYPKIPFPHFALVLIKP